jgi:hypothetical protein
MMRLRVLIGAWALVGVGVAAQPPAPGPGPQAAEQPRPLTLTGCVKAWDASTMGPPPAALSMAAPVLVLTDAQNALTPAPGRPSAASDPAPPRSDSARAAGGHSTYLLKPASPTVNLASHLEHRVELVGTLATDHAAATPVAPTTPPGSSATGAPDPAGERSGVAPTPPVSFTVTGIKMIDKSCAVK